MSQLVHNILKSAHHDPTIATRISQNPILKTKLKLKEIIDGNIILFSDIDVCPTVDRYLSQILA